MSEGISGKSVGNVFRVLAFVVLLLWVALAFLPLVALRSGYFTLNTAAEVEKFPKILQQLGTFGDMYGMLNCLFSGAAFVGVIYTIILQQRQIHLQEQDSLKSERSAGIQNRLVVYQNLRDHHQYRHDNAKADILLKARSKGRALAFAELTANLLRESEAYINGVEATAPQEQNFHDHPARIGYLAYQYKEEMKSVIDSKVPFGPVHTLLLDLVEEIAALTELAKTNTEVQTLLLDAGHAVNAAVQPCDLLAPESTAECIRSYQIKQADLAFEKAVFAAAALFPTIVVERNSAQH